VEFIRIFSFWVHFDDWKRSYGYFYLLLISICWKKEKINLI